MKDREDDMKDIDDRLYEVENKLDKVLEALHEVQLKLASNKEEIERLESEKRVAEERAWELSMGEDL